MNHATPLRAALAATLLSMAGAALAHPGADGGMHGFLAGLAHPFTGLDHLLAIVAVGFWSVSLGRRGWLAATAFPVAVLVGALLAAGGVAVFAIEPMIAASLPVVGLLIAAPARFAWPGIALVGVFAFFHGAAHGNELPGDAAALVGMLAGTLLLLAIGAALGTSARPRGAWWPRATGAAVSLVGAALLVPLLTA